MLSIVESQLWLTTGGRSLKIYQMVYAMCQQEMLLNGSSRKGWAQNFHSHLVLLGFRNYRINSTIFRHDLSTTRRTGMLMLGMDRWLNGIIQSARSMHPYWVALLKLYRNTKIVRITASADCTCWCCTWGGCKLLQICSHEYSYEMQEKNFWSQHEEEGFPNL